MNERFVKDIAQDIVWGVCELLLQLDGAEDKREALLASRDVVLKNIEDTFNRAVETF
jgi:hypothetical protein